MLQAAARDDVSGFAQRLDDGVVGVALVAIFLQDALAGEAGGGGVITPSASTVNGMVVSMPRSRSAFW